MISIQRANPQLANQLTQIAIRAKAHWRYPERWLEIWKPQLTFSPQYFEENVSWMATTDELPIGFYTLQERKGKAWLENLFVLPEYIGKGIGRALFLHAVELSRQHK